MWELDYKESWAPTNGCFWTVVLEKTLETALDCKEIKPLNPKRNQSWIFTGRTDAEADTPVLWPPGVKNWLIGKDPDIGKDWRREEKGMSEDEMVGWHHQLGHKFEQALAVGDGQGSLACCSPRGRKESDTTEQLKWNEWHSENEKYLIKSRKHSSSRDGVLYHSWKSGMPKADQSQRSNPRTMETDGDELFCHNLHSCFSSSACALCTLVAKSCLTLWPQAL